MRYILALLALALLFSPAFASVELPNVSPALDEVLSDGRQCVCTEEAAAWPEAIGQLAGSLWPEEYCSPDARVSPFDYAVPLREQAAMVEAASGPLGMPITASLFTSYAYNPLAAKSVQDSFTLFTDTIRTRFAMWLGRSGKYLPLFRGILKEEGLPEDLAFLPLIESGFSTHAYSRAKASGPWQFIAGTAKRYGLKVDKWVDERRDPVKSTRAAARYLLDLYDMFDSWSLALAAYNAGEGKIKKALTRANSDDYWGLIDTKHIRRETKDYVPRFIAARQIAVDPEGHGFPDIAYEDEFVYDEAVIKAPVSLDVAARCAGTTVEKIKELNPELKRSSTPPVSEYKLRIPQGSSEAFVEAMARVPAAKKVTVGEYRVRRGDTVSKIARKLGVDQDDLIAANKLGKKAFLREGQVLSVPSLSSHASAASPAAKVGESSGEAKVYKVYKVKRGDTLLAISRATGVRTATIMAMNKIANGSRIKAGQELVIPVAD